MAAGVRRIEALTGRAALDSVLLGRRLLSDIGRAAKTRPDLVVARVEALRADLRRAEREVERLRGRIARESADGGAPEDIAGVLVWMPAPLDGASKHEHRRLVDDFRDRHPGRSFVAVSAAVRDGRAAVIVAVSADLEERLPANRLLAEAAAAIGGRGGGRAGRAEGGGPKPEGLPAMNEKIREAVRAATSRAGG